MMAFPTQVSSGRGDDDGIYPRQVSASSGDDGVSSNATLSDTKSELDISANLLQKSVYHLKMSQTILLVLPSLLTLKSIKG